MTIQIISWIRTGLLPLLLISAISCEDPRAVLIRGHIASVNGNEIAITPLQARSSARPLVLSIDLQKTRILARRVESGTMNLEPADRADLIVGREVAVTAYGRRASVVRVFPPKPVGGRVARVEGGTLVISLDDGSERHPRAAARFAMTGQTKILFKTIESTALAPATPSELKLGRRVFVYAQGNDAVAVKIVPEPPVVGSVVRIDGNSIVIRRAGNGGGPEETKIPYRTNSVRAVVQYFGTDITARASLGDIKPGTRASVYVGEDGTVAVKYMSTPLPGRLLAADRYSIMFQADGQSTASQRFRIIPAKTVIIVSKSTGTVSRANGRSSKNFMFGSGTFRDLRPGQPVLVSAVDNVLYAVEIMPMPMGSLRHLPPAPGSVSR